VKSLLIGRKLNNVCEMITLVTRSVSMIISSDRFIAVVMTLRGSRRCRATPPHQRRLKMLWAMTSKKMAVPMTS
jgi:hypothetical protein